MKKLIIALSIGFAITIFNTQTIEAQHVSVNINLDFQPAWGPSGYQYAEFYYLPDLNIYYDINNGLFIYMNGRNWVTNFYLPKKYNRYDLYLMHKVVLNNIRNPWMHNQYHRRQYAHFRNNRSQVAIYYMNDHRYHQARQNHWAWVEPRYMPKQKAQNQKHLIHEHKQVQLSKNQYRSTAGNSKNNLSGNNKQATNNNKNTNRDKQSTAGTNRVESRSSSNAGNNKNRSSAGKQNEIRKNENKQVQKSENHTAKRNEQAANNSKRTEKKSSGVRSTERNSSVEKQNEKKEDKQAQRTESKSRSGGRSGSTR